MKQEQCQILIVGAGITGLTIAREFINRGTRDILIIEKEHSLGLHLSGRNSGILHAGMYYTADTLKAKFCVKGRKMMKKFCQEKGLMLYETGKVILANNPSEVEALHELKRRADLCGAHAFLTDSGKLREIEPHAAACCEALFSPETAVIRPVDVLKALEDELIKSAKVAISYDTLFEGLYSENRAQTSKGVVQFEKFVNAAGSYVDQVAHQFGLAKEYKIVPVKAIYKKLAHNRTFLVRGNIFPVPDLRTPFLGVYLTRSADDEILVGPVAVPAFGRENYQAFKGLGLETFAILFRDYVLMFKNHTFRRVALTELGKYLRRFFFNEARRLVPELHINDLVETDHVAIRPQLIHWPTKTLVIDPVVIRHNNSLHILNPVSPGFTSSMAFAEEIADQWDY